MYRILLFDLPGMRVLCSSRLVCWFGVQAGAGVPPPTSHPSSPPPPPAVAATVCASSIPQPSAPLLRECTDDAVVSFLEAAMATRNSSSAVMQSLASVADLVPRLCLEKTEERRRCVCIGPLLPWIVSLTQAHGLYGAIIERCMFLLRRIAWGATDKVQSVTVLLIIRQAMSWFRARVSFIVATATIL
jgi:hypothetical protein